MFGTRVLNRPGRRLPAAVTAVLLAVTGCSTASGSRPPAPSSEHRAVEVGTPHPSVAPAPPAPPCDPGRSLTPRGPFTPNGMPAGTRMREIQERGHLIAGVDQNTRFFAVWDPDARELVGFDIAIVREVAKAIFGDPDRVVFRVIPPGERITVVERGEVDIVVDTVSVTCDRWQRVDFSAVYYEDSRRFLVPKGVTVSSLDDLAGQRVCASTDTTPLREIAESDAIPYAVSDRTDCLVALQEGTAAAAYTNSALLHGLAAQDPQLHVVGPEEITERAGIAVRKGDTDLVRFLNAVLERMKTDGTWRALHDEWLRPVLGPQDPPKTVYEG